LDLQALETNNIEEILLKYELLDLLSYFQKKEIKSSHDLRANLHLFINQEVLFMIL